jgi:hypothetical protein
VLEAAQSPAIFTKNIFPETISKRGIPMFGVEEITRIRIQDATREGLQSQKAYRDLGEKQKSVPRRLLEVIAAAVVHIITLKS